MPTYHVMTSSVSKSAPKKKLAAKVKNRPKEGKIFPRGTGK